VPESPAPRPLRQCVVAVAREGERFLVIRRGPTVPAPGRICFPGGHVEPGETEHEAVVRECREEIALAVAPRECVWRSVSPWGAALAWWTVDIVDPSAPVPHPVEVAEILWLSAVEMLADPTLLEGNRSFVEAIIAGEFPL
jgi:8-oxo-dGTP diphosphatase